jgi:hypothetical protein
MRQFAFGQTKTSKQNCEFCVGFAQFGGVGLENILFHAVKIDQI